MKSEESDRAPEMRFLVRFGPSAGTKAGFLSSMRSIAKAVGAEARNPKWTSHGALELDIFVPSTAEFETFLAATEPLGKLEFFRDLNLAPAHISEEELFSEARSYFNAERYWECHEVLEGAWRNLQGEEKRYVQGIILVCAAFVHLQKGEEGVAMSVLKRASKQLGFGETAYQGFDVRSFKQQVEEIITKGRFEVFRI